MSKGQSNQLDLEGRRRNVGEARSKRANAMTLGMHAFEKISAVEGVHLTERMRRDALALSVDRAGAVRKK